MNAFNLSALAVRERSVTLFLLVAIFIAGVVAFLTLGRAEDPSFTIKQMTVVTAWPGATAKEMEELVAERLEKRMQELRWYDRTETFTRPGLAFTTVFLRDSTPPADVPAVLSGAEEARRRGASVAAWRHRSDGERRIRRCDLCALRVEGEGRVSSAPRARCGNLAPAPAARAGRQESEHHRRAGGKDLRRVLLRPPRNTGRVAARHLRRAQQPQRYDASRRDRSQGPASPHQAGRGHRRSAEDPHYARRRARPYAEARRHCRSEARLRRPGHLPDPQQRRADVAARRGHARGMERPRPRKRAGSGSGGDQRANAARHDPLQGHGPVRQHSDSRRRVHGQVSRRPRRGDARELSQHGMARRHRGRRGGSMLRKLTSITT